MKLSTEEMFVVWFFVFVFSKLIHASIVCEHHSAICFIPVGETMRLLWNDKTNVDCSVGHQWSFKLNDSYYYPLSNGTDGFAWNCSNGRAWLTKDRVESSQSREYRCISKSQHSFIVVVVNVTLRIQPSVDGKSHAALLQLFPPINSPSLIVSGFNCPSTQSTLHWYIRDPHWKVVVILSVEGFSAPQLCCRFNVSMDSHSKEFFIRPDTTPSVTPCPIVQKNTLKTETPDFSPHTGGTDRPNRIKSMSILMPSVFILIASLN